MYSLWNSSPFEVEDGGGCSAIRSPGERDFSAVYHVLEVSARTKGRAGASRLSKEMEWCGQCETRTRATSRAIPEFGKHVGSSRDTEVSMRGEDEESG